MPRNSPDEGLIHAWLDGELSPDEAARVERLVREDPEWAAAASEARGLMAASSRILGALDVVPGDVLPQGSRAAPAAGAAAARSRSRFSVRPWMRVAAGLVLVVGTAVIVNDRAGVDAAFETVAAPAPAVAEDRAAAQAAAPATGRSQPTADAAAPAQKVTTQSRAVTPPPAPAPEPDPVEAARAITPPTDIPQVGNAMRLRSERGFGTVSAKARPMAAGITSSAAILDGCWRTLTRAPVDSILLSPRILNSTGETLTILATTHTATVVQKADTLLGTIDHDGTRIPFRAERTACR